MSGFTRFRMYERPIHAKTHTQFRKYLDPCGREAFRHTFYDESLGTFSIRFFMGNSKLQIAKCHVTTALRSRLQFAVHV